MRAFFLLITGNADLTTLSRGTRMLRESIIALAASLVIASSSFAMAKEGCGGECASCHKLTQQDAADLLRKIGGTVKSVKQSPARGLFELLVEKDGRQGVIFMDYGRKHLIQGAVFDLATLQPVAAHAQDLPQPKQVTSLDVKTIPLANAVTIGNPKGNKHIYVFTDPDCPYCRKAHSELKKLAKIAPDVAIHIMLYPLAMHPAAYGKSRAILEGKSRDILDKAFEGKEVPSPVQESSKKAIDEIIAFANANGISGTPTVVMPDGRIEVGIRDAESLKKMLEAR
jgi:thiol:disulfide interchange protein DsbC